MKPILLALTVVFITSCTQVKDSGIAAKVIDSIAYEGRYFYMDSISESVFNAAPKSDLKEWLETSKPIEKDDMLQLKADKRQFEVINNDEEFRGFIRRFMINYYEGKPFAHIKVAYIEGGTDYFFDMRTSEAVKLWGDPVFSVDSNRIVAYCADLMAGYSTNGFQVFRFGPKRLEPLIIAELTEWGPEEIRWESNESILIKRVRYSDELQAEFDYVRMRIEP